MKRASLAMSLAAGVMLGAASQAASVHLNELSVRSRNAAIQAQCRPGRHQTKLSICQARAACVRDSSSAECDSYCNLNPIDRVCDVGSTSSSSPGTESPYPWARSGSYCEEHPYAITCYRSGNCRGTPEGSLKIPKS